MRVVALLALSLCGSACNRRSEERVDEPRPVCTAEAERDGRALYPRVFDAKPVREEPSLKAVVPKHTVGAKLYLTPEKGMTTAYLAYAATCYARSTLAPVTADPLRPGGDVPSVFASEAANALVLTVTSPAAETGREIWDRAQALVAQNRAAR